VQTRRRIIAVYKRVACSKKNFGDFLIAGHDDNDLGCGGFVEHSFDSLRAADRVCDKLVYAKQPWDGKKTSKRQEGKSLEEADHGLRKVLRDLRWEWKCNNHDGKKDGTKRCEEDHHNDGQDPYTNSVGFLENFDQAVQESSDPKEPLEQSCKHDGADDGDIDDILCRPRVGNGGDSICIVASKNGNFLPNHGERRKKIKS